MLKREYGLDSVFRGGKDVGRVVSAVYLCNVERLHKSLGYATPARGLLGASSSQ